MTKALCPKKGHINQGLGLRVSFSWERSGENTIQPTKYVHRPIFSSARVSQACVILCTRPRLPLVTSYLACFSVSLPFLNFFFLVPLSIYGTSLPAKRGAGALEAQRQRRHARSLSSRSSSRRRVRPRKSLAQQLREHVDGAHGAVVHLMQPNWPVLGPLRLLGHSISGSPPLLRYPPASWMRLFPLASEGFWSLCTPSHACVPLYLPPSYSLCASLIKEAEDCPACLWVLQ